MDKTKTKFILMLYGTILLFHFGKTHLLGPTVMNLEGSNVCTKIIQH